MNDYLHLRLEAPIMSWGASYAPAARSSDDIATEPSGVPTGIALFPGRPMLTGLIANALGYDRSEGARHQALSERLRFAAAIVREGREFQDLQTSELRADDRGWTTHGRFEGRRGATYDTPAVRRKRGWADGEALIVARLLDGPGEDMATVAAALQRPERPLFLGRKAYLPSSPIYRGALQAATAYDAALDVMAGEMIGMIWDLGEGPDDAPIVDRDDRGWVAGVHQGEYRMRFDRPNVHAPNAEHGPDDLW